MNRVDKFYAVMAQTKDGSLISVSGLRYDKVAAYAVARELAQKDTSGSVYLILYTVGAMMHCTAPGDSMPIEFVY